MTNTRDKALNRSRRHAKCAQRDVRRRSHTDQHADLLARHGVDLNDLTERFGGSLGDYL
jgi:hypothetical protein